MIELERDESQDTQVWADANFSHVIVEETEDTVRVDIPMAPGFYVRDEDGAAGPWPTLDSALEAAHSQWGDAVALAPALRLERDVAVGRAGEVGDFLLEYLATYGAVGIDARELAQQVFARIEEE